MADRFEKSNRQDRVSAKKITPNTLFFIALIAFMAGIVLSEPLKSALNKQKSVHAQSSRPVVNDNAPVPVVVKAPEPAGGNQKTNPSASQNQPGQLTEHQQHLADIGAKMAEAAKTGNYSYLFTAIDAKEEIYKIDFVEAKYLFDSGKAVFVDARSPAEYEESHVKGAVLLPPSATPDELERLKRKLNNKILVTYCHGTGCHLADKTALKLYEAGYRNIAIFFGGWPKWTEHKYPITTR